MIGNRVCAVVGAKGGVGKTTTSINLGASLAATGYSVVVVELDLAMANIVDFVDIDEEVSEATTLHDVLAGEASPEEACYRAANRLSVAISGTDLTGYAGTDMDRLPDVVERLQWRHDVVLLDTPAGLSEQTARPLQLADTALLVSTPRVASIRNARNTLELAGHIGTDVHGLVLTKSGTGASPGAEQIADFLDVELLGHVPEDDAVPHSQDRGSPVVEYAPQSGAAIAYQKIAEKLDAGKAGDGRTPSGPDTGGRFHDRHPEETADGRTGGRRDDRESDTDESAGTGRESAPAHDDSQPEPGESTAQPGSPTPATAHGTVRRWAVENGPDPPGESHAGQNTTERETDRDPDEHAAPGEAPARDALTVGTDGGQPDATGSEDGQPGGTNADDDASLGERLRSLFRFRS